MANDHEGHRRRLMQKAATEDVLEQEGLEILLFPLVPRKNTSDLAHRLIARFGCAWKVYEASTEELKEVEGVGDRLAENIFVHGKIIRRYLQKGGEQRGFDSRQFMAEIRQEYAAEEKEVLDVYFLNADGQICDRHRFSSDRLTKVQMFPVELTHLFVDELPSGVVLVHNHVVGDATPSSADDGMTKCVQLVCNMYGALFCDHIVVSRTGAFSYYLNGDLQKISREYTFGEIAGKDRK